MTSGVMVVGMHRSGTSAVTRLVNLLGVPLGREDDIYSAQDNPSGHWESRQLCALNDVVLKVFGGFDMAMPPMPPSWLRSRRAEHLRGVMRATFDDVYRSERWLWKDPRVCLTLPLWREVLDDFCVVFVVRDAEPVARSLHRREKGYPFSYCYALWDDYNRRAVNSLSGLPVVTVDFDLMMKEPLNQVKLLAEGLSSVGVQLNADVDSAVSSLRQQSGPGTSAGGLGRRLAAALKSGPNVSQVFEPPPLPAQPLWMRPTLRAGCTRLKYLERRADGGRNLGGSQ